MNHGLRRGFSRVGNPRAAEEPESPWNFRLVNVATNITANPWDLCFISVNNANVFLPPNAAIGDMVMVVVRTGIGFNINPTAPQQLNQGTIGIQINGPNASSNHATATFMYLGLTFGWITVAAVGTDGGVALGLTGQIGAVANVALTTSGALTATGVFKATAGTDTSAAAAVTAPTIGAAAVVNSTTDVELKIAVTAAGQLTVAYGPTSGVANTILSATAVAAGQLITFRVPKGWFVAVTTSSTATWTATATVE